MDCRGSEQLLSMVIKYALNNVAHSERNSLVTSYNNILNNICIKYFHIDITQLDEDLLGNVQKVRAIKGTECYYLGIHDGKDNIVSILKCLHFWPTEVSFIRCPNNKQPYFFVYLLIVYLVTLLALVLVNVTDVYPNISIRYLLLGGRLCILPEHVSH